MTDVWLSARRTACIALALVSIAQSAAGADAWTDSSRYEFEYRVDLAAIPAGEGADVRLWLPVPAQTNDQHVLAHSVEAPFAHRDTRDDAGNGYAHFTWRGPVPAGAEVVARWTVERAPSTGLPRDEATPGSRDDPTRHLGASRRVPLDGMIGALAVQEGEGLESDGEKIRAYYDYVVKNMRYAKDGNGWGQGDAVWACTSKYGNCTDFHSLFLGMARSQGIPARFVIGFPIQPNAAAADVAGYHCWAEAWDPTRGWVPLDASEAWKSKRFDDYFGRLPSDRIEFTVGRDLTLAPAQSGKPLNYFIYPYAEVDGVPAENVPARFRFRRLESDLARR